MSIFLGFFSTKKTLLANFLLKINSWDGYNEGISYYLLLVFLIIYIGYNYYR